MFLVAPSDVHMLLSFQSFAKNEFNLMYHPTCQAGQVVQWVIDQVEVIDSL